MLDEIPEQETTLLPDHYWSYFILFTHISNKYIDRHGLRCRYTYITGFVMLAAPRRERVSRDPGNKQGGVQHCEEAAAWETKYPRSLVSVRS